ncbi:MAG: sensor signal transduction histidine kinase [Pseudobdellovibrio sp.]|jgi:PAS domain S-box-containing protein|nr:sensor signal transduction histidine kinase [Pseudobdellovibrio sp.]
MATNGLKGSDFDHLKSAIDEAAIVAITDQKGTITYVNKKFCAISKYTQEELLGQNHRIINSGYHSKEFFVDMWKTIANGHTWEGEVRNRAKDGTYYWVNTTIVPFMNDQGKPVQYVSVRYEITERKLAEEKLKVYAKKLEVSNQELQDFASVAAHDLQEPLRKILSFADRLQTKAKDELRVETVDYLNRIQSSAQRMRVLINDLLTYSRVTTKAQPFVKVDLNQVLNDVVSDLEVRLEQSGGTVKIDPLPTIDADATQMRQLFQNLISNALKFVPADRKPDVAVTSQLLNGSPLGQPACQITVTDNGIGFEEKYLDRIFTIFQRLHGRHEYEGTGIGLAVCRKITDRHGGILTATSRVGEGSSFIITLPLKQNAGSSV